MDYSTEVHLKAIELGKLVLRMTSHAGSGHPSSALSIAHIITVLMYRVLRFDYNDPWNPANDRLVLSEGHAVPIVYAAYADLGGIYGMNPATAVQLRIDDLASLRRIDSALDGHPNPSAGFPFFDCATGSLGQGLSIACGVALAARINHIDRRVYVVIGDGESREGQVWEACDFLVERRLHEIVPIFNCNGFGQSDPVSHQQSPAVLESKLKSFGFDVNRIDGHNPAAILDALTRAAQRERPAAIVAETVKGWGVKELQHVAYHGKPLSSKTIETGIEDLEKLRISVQRDQSGVTKMSPLQPERISVPRRHAGRLGSPEFEELLSDDSAAESFRKSGRISTRRAYGLALRELARLDNRIVGLDADVKNSTYAEYLAKAVPERYFEARIAEQNMISVAAGLARNGFIPFVSSFARFLTRGYDQLEIALISSAPIKLCGSHSGANIGADGPSQMGLSDLSYMRGLSTAVNENGIPLMTIFNPACAVCAYKCVQLMADIGGACYLRTLRTDLPLLYDRAEEFVPGGAKQIRDGADVSLMATGYMVHECIKLAAELASSGIEASVWDCYSLPLQPELVAEAAARGSGRILVVEDNYGNGLGSEVASIVAADASINSIVKQRFVHRVPKSGLSAEDVLAFVGLKV